MRCFGGDFLCILTFAQPFEKQRAPRGSEKERERERERELRDQRRPTTAYKDKVASAAPTFPVDQFVFQTVTKSLRALLFPISPVLSVLDTARRRPLPFVFRFSGGPADRTQCPEPSDRLKS
jgi:hypothetical protein